MAGQGSGSSQMHIRLENNIRNNVEKQPSEIQICVFMSGTACSPSARKGLDHDSRQGTVKCLRNGARGKEFERGCSERAQNGGPFSRLLLPPHKAEDIPRERERVR